MQPGWLGYIGVDDVDTAIAAIEHAGGTVWMPATDIPDVGRVALISDPQGVPIYLMRGAREESSGAFSEHLPGHCGWNELATDDLVGALTFYAGQFGWEDAGVMDMGPMGGYHFLAHTGRNIGAMMQRAEGMPPARWAFYFRVASIAAAAERIVAGGGQVVMGPHALATGDRIVIGVDPQGIAFHLVGCN